ncbi:hypothetical protein ACM39_12845 [Chryseobacterium sp. FH2]|uniref:DUF6705 family protein n=1 Tax=Chryseobacterium sp. FH2 TaxID=1674291 RepID=UPI00065AD686|nr:DUF6705 family protein [Chryseobacterium sp. FH2]KMQ67721.1 hypothetical protein ACM39_12845 [Chryseobacterium sp. FH2]
MKNIILLMFLITTISCKAQIYPLSTSAGDVPSGAYIKDINNELDQYVGLWKANWQGKTIYLDLRKIKLKSESLMSSFYYYSDQILGERKIIDANGTVEIDRISNFDNENAEFWGVTKSLLSSQYVTITFFPKNMCNKMASLDIKFLNPEKTQMQMKFRYVPSLLDENCQYANLIKSGGDLPINFPKEDIIFIKQ